MTEQKTPSADFLDLWKRSAPPKLEEKKAIAEKIPLSDKHHLWTNIAQLSPADRTKMMGRLTTLWPYTKERRALNWPLHAGLLANCLSTSFVAAKINADMIGLDRKMSFLESVRTCPKSPFVFGIYTSGICFYILQQSFITPLIYREDDPCSSCLLSRSAAIGITSGILMPMLTTPYLCHYVLMQRQHEKYPEIKNMLEFFTLSIEGSKAARPLALPLIALQTTVAAISIYSVLWARKRVFDTMDADPELAKELIIKAQIGATFKEKVIDKVKTIPFFGSIVPTPPEEEEC